MADIHRLPNARKVEQEASEWIARLNADDVTAEDRTSFEAWRHAHPLHAQAFEDLSRTWNRFLQAGQLARAATFAESMIPEADDLRRGRWRPRFAAAAALIAVSLLLGLYLARSAPPTLFRTAIGEQLAVRLPDGSLMELNSNSMARVDYSARRRIIHLDRGEAFFKVDHDASRPFWVGAAGGGWVRDVGTQFDVYLRATNVQVTVTEGTVRVGASRDSLAAANPAAGRQADWVTLTRDEQADLAGSVARKRLLSAEEVAEAMAWRSGTVYFDNRPVAEVAAELNRYSVEQLIVEGDALRTMRVGGAFQANPKGAAALLGMLEQNFGVQARREGTHIYLRRLPPQGH
jgi:transmembrane sensor